MEKENKELTMDFIRSVMEDSYTLVWVNYDDNLNENLDVIETCMKEKSAMTLYDKSVMGTKKTGIYVALVIIMATISGQLYGYFF